eukprot:m51a1_g210 hypothetical protein (405) ;mRNA; f:10973-12343
MVNVDIALNGSHVFVAGSTRTVSGSVLLHLDAPLRAFSVTTTLVCLAGASDLLRRQCRWVPPGHVVPAGSSAVRFDLGAIDGALPGSHEELRGSYVRYYVAVEVARPSGCFNVRRYAPVAVVSLAAPLRKRVESYAALERALAGVRGEPEFRLSPPEATESFFLGPAASEAAKAFGLPSLTRGNIVVSLSVPRRAYGYGEAIEAAVRVRNSSGRRVRDVQVRVSQRCTCGATGFPQGRWCRVLARVSTGCAVEPGKEASVLVHLRAPVASTSFTVDLPQFWLTVRHTLDVDVRYKGAGRRLTAGVAIDLNSMPRGAEAAEWSQQRIAELAETVRPCIPWKVYDSESEMLGGPHVQALCIPVDRELAPQSGAHEGQLVVEQGEPLCDEPCFVAVNTNPAPYKYPD